MDSQPVFIDVANDFGPFDGRTWINCSHQGPLPRVAAEQAECAIHMKVAPHHLANSTAFSSVPEQLRKTLARLIDADPEDIILGNSTSYGLNLLANGLHWHEGDEVLVVKGDFPASIFPWLPLRSRGVGVRFIEPNGPCVTPDEVEARITPRTRLFCVTWVHSFTGYAIDERAFADVCARHGVLFVLNASQAMGARPFRVRESGVDAVVSCGFKWLCGPYGTGFCWIRPEVRESLGQTKGYWLANMTADHLRGDIDYELRPDLGVRAYDLFCPANFFNFMPWRESIEYLLGHGLERIAAHDDALVSRLIDHVDREKYEILSPTEAPAKSTIVVLEHRDKSANERIFEALGEQGIDISLRRGRLRISPHLYNTPGDIDRLVEVLNAFDG